jgi:type IV pilus assembly protein PilQ
MSAALVLLGALVACATAPKPSDTAASEPAVLADVRVVNEGATTVVSLVGAEDPVFRSFQQGDPARVVVDLTGVVPGEVAKQLAVYDGTVDEVTVTRFADGSGRDATRVELALGTVAEHEVLPVQGGLQVRVTPTEQGSLGASEELAADRVEDPWAWEPEAGQSEPETIDAEELAAREGGEAGAMTGADEAEAMAAGAEDASEAAAAEAEALAAAPKAQTLEMVQSEAAGSGARLALAADGRIDGASHFALEDPVRLVVDLPGLTNRFPESRLLVGQGPVSRVRIGQHEDKVRVVVDAAEGVQSLEPAQLVPTADGLVVALAGAGVDGMAKATAEAAPASEATPPAAPAEPAMAREAGSEGPLRVYGVQFDAQEERDRITILSDGVASFQTVAPDADTVMVRVTGATIDPEAEVNIAPSDPGMVSLVTAFEQPEVGEPEVRVVIRKVPGAEPEIRQEGTMLFVDFPHDGSVAQAVPAVAGTHAAAVETQASQKAMAQTARDAVDESPAAIATDDPAALDILKEGGLVDGKAYTGRRISLDFKDVDIDDVLRLIAEVSDLNIIAGDEVQGEVTIRLVDVPWDQALDVILLTKGLGFVRVGNVLRIAPAEVIKAEEEARLQEKRAKEKLEDLVVKLQPVNYANVKDVEAMVKRLLTPRGSVDIDERTNTIILKDIASVIDESTALIKAIDTQTPQVMIEAKIVEANLDFIREIGSRWALGVQPRVDGFDENSALRQNENIGNDVVLRNIQNPVLGGLTNANNVAVANPITELATGVINLGAFILDERFDVDLQLEAAESHGEGKVISSPRVVTLDNREASIEQGVSIPFQTFENGDAKLEFIDAVLRLEVKPHITADRSIIMEIQVQRNAPDDSVPTPTGSPAIAKNEAETETLVRDGQTLVIGGIYVVRKADRESRVPYFHKIPILGNAFKNKELRDARQELLVFVTPRIVVNPELGT